MGKIHGYYPEDPVSMWKIDSTLDAIDDLIEAYSKYALNTEEESKKQAKENLFTNVYPKFLSIMEKRMTDNSSKDFFVGDKITIADFGLAALFYSHIANPTVPNPDFRDPVEKHPVLLKYF